MTNSDIVSFLHRSGLSSGGETLDIEPLTGGVSSDIWKVTTRGGPVCVKRALSKLKTDKEWHAPVERNANEVDWIQTASMILPNSVPKILAEDGGAGMFAMSFMEPAEYPVWKEQLRDGIISTKTAYAVGDTLGLIHAATADTASVARRFATDDIFHAIRIEPYLLRTAETCDDVAERLITLARTTAETRRVLVHGDVSPKNILIGPDGPVIIDAECAWFGDPAFDLAFCLNHLLLKCIWKPTNTASYLSGYDALASAYLNHISWEPPAKFEARTAELLPGLLLARIDGTSPVEYITSNEDKQIVRRAARRGLNDPPVLLSEFRETFRKECS
ncbi:MAG: hypothetical protein CFH41_00557 [Alphaproteobacteria bacterium MarineAlpha11_Bin1]|nr:MAG: hypothetical protein CFH41_00557 [Alphaproteobacteria bacterium MarineAlpha11_Bin1]